MDVGSRVERYVHGEISQQLQLDEARSGEKQQPQHQQPLAAAVPRSYAAAAARTAAEDAELIPQLAAEAELIPVGPTVVFESAADAEAAQALHASQQHLVALQQQGQNTSEAIAAAAQHAAAAQATPGANDLDPNDVISTSRSGIQFTRADMERVCITKPAAGEPPSPDKAAGSGQQRQQQQKREGGSAEDRPGLPWKAAKDTSLEEVLSRHQVRPGQNL